MVLAHQLEVDPNAPNLPLQLDVNDPVIEERIFTHPSFNGDPTAGFEHADSDASNNQTLAIRGDAILREMVAGMVEEKYPRLTPGGQTRILSALLSNETLARISVRFGFHQRIRAASHQFQTIQNGVVAQATVFEAYVGGLIAAGTPRPEVQEFVSAIFGQPLYNEYTWLSNGGFEKPLVQAIATPTEAPKLPAAPVNRLATVATAAPSAAAVMFGPAAPAALGVPSSTGRSSLEGHPVHGQNWISAIKEHNESRGRSPRGIEYEDSKIGSSHAGVWLAKVFIGGVPAGSGQGSTKQAARSNAAAEAYLNRVKVWGY